MEQDSDVLEYKIAISNCKNCSLSPDMMVCEKFCSFYKTIHELDGKNHGKKTMLFSINRMALKCYRK